MWDTYYTKQYISSLLSWIRNLMNINETNGMVVLNILTVARDNKVLSFFCAVIGSTYGGHPTLMRNIISKVELV